MTPEQLRQFEEMKKKIDEIYTSDGYAKLSNGIFIDDRIVVDADVNVSTVIGAGGGTVNHLDFPDRWLVVRYKDKPYLVPMYSFTRL